MSSSWLTSHIYWIVDVSSWLTCALITILILIYHLFKIYQDLFTEERKSIEHRPTKPEVNKTYIIITVFSLLTIVMYASALALGGMGNLYFMRSVCTIVSVSVSVSWQLAKCGLYIVLLLRLHIVYKGSQYRYNPKILSFIGIITIITNVIFLALICIFTYSDHYKTYEFSPIAIVCSTILPEALLYSTAAYDVIMSCACLFAFVLPLKRLIESMPDVNAVDSSETSRSVSPRTKQRNTDKKIVSKHSARLAAVGLKFLIVTMTAVLSSLMCLIFVGITDMFLVISFDMLINAICVLLMTPYYPDDVYYNRLCFCCVQCCIHCKYHGMDSKLQVVNRRIEASTTSQPPSSDVASKKHKVASSFNPSSPSSINSDNRVFEFNDNENIPCDLQKVNSISLEVDNTIVN